MTRRLRHTWDVGTAEGMSKRDVIRCLKRYVAREVYSAIRRPAKTLEKAA